VRSSHGALLADRASMLRQFEIARLVGIRPYQRDCLTFPAPIAVFVERLPDATHWWSGAAGSFAARAFGVAAIFRFCSCKAVPQLDLNPFNVRRGRDAWRCGCCALDPQAPTVENTLFEDSGSVEHTLQGVEADAGKRSLLDGERPTFLEQSLRIAFSQAKALGLHFFMLFGACDGPVEPAASASWPGAEPACDDFL